MITNLYDEKVYTLMINDDDMDGDVPNFTTFKGQPLKNGTIAVNMDRAIVFSWDQANQAWKNMTK